MSTTFTTRTGCSATINRIGDGIGITITQPSGETKTFALLASEAREFSILLAMEASDGLNPWAATLLALDPQTSGGLLLGVPRAHRADFERACAEHDVRAVPIGDATAGSGVLVTGRR